MEQQNGMPKKFDKCLEEIMEKRELSVTQLSYMLGYKSKTPLLRSMQGKAGVRSLGNIYEDMCSCAALALTEGEKNDLGVACQIEYYGLDHYRARLEMHRLLLKDTCDNQEKTSMTICTAAGTKWELTEFLGRFVRDDKAMPDTIPVKNVEILLCGGCYQTVTEAVADMMWRLGDVGKVKHIFRLNDDMAQTIRYIRNLVPLVGFQNYEAYITYDVNVMKDNVYRYSSPGHAMLIKVTTHTEPNETREFQLLLQNEKCGVVLESPGVWDVWQQYILPVWSGARLIVSPPPCVRDYVSLLKHFTMLEKSRELLAFKRDFCLNFIPPDILYHAILDTASYISDSCTEVVEVVDNLDRLWSLQEKRFQNICTKKSPTHWVASTAAMRKFARTGVQSDHFFAMRPFTVEERVRIFRVLQDLCRENQSFHFYLLKEEEEDRYIPLEANYYVGIGFHMTPIDAHYNLSNQWNETLITETDFCELYREFYLKELLPYHTKPYDETMAVLDEIVERLEKGEIHLLA